MRIHMHLGAHAGGDEAGAAALTANGPSVASCSVRGGLAIVEIGQTTLVFLPQIHVFAYPFCHVEMNFT